MQSQQPNTHRGTPGRGRGNRHSTNSAARRTYASENDMVADSSGRNMDYGDGSPLTPQKLATRSPAPGSQPNNARSSKQRTANKQRQKQGTISPAPTKPARTTPPQSAAPKPIGAAAFAGATFHASPAPSSLPIPSFLAKALDSPALKDAGRISQEPSPPPTDSEAAPTPKHRSLVPDVAREESPLDVFFRADRAEKERARRASSANVLASNPGPFSPPVESKSPQEPRTLPGGVGGYLRKPTLQRNTSGGISSSELDGTPWKPMGPAFSTPYQDRIRAAARSIDKPSGPATPSRVAAQQTSDDRSERLKKFLAVSTNPGPAQPTNPAAPPQTSTSISPNWAAPSAQPIQPTMPYSLGTTDGRPSELLHMEDSLRRMLKISPGPTPGPLPPGNYYQSS